MDSGKRIEIVTRFPYPRYIIESDNIADYWDFITIPSMDSGLTFTVQHSIPPKNLLEANLQKGEKYKVELSNKCLGTIWWMFGPDPRGKKGVKLKSWIDRETEPEEWAEALENDDENVFRGERDPDLALVDETGGTIFEIV